MPGALTVSRRGIESRTVVSLRDVSCGVWAARGIGAASATAAEHKSAFRCTRYDLDARAFGAGSQVHRPPVYFTP